ncbi:lipid droplet-associated protein [Saccharomonospora saliphila]|uniref:lipid droplet-associated protein n=1 Tax=Saccharomonospora saliphila TaxID=369829 RepID=UPI00035D2D0E|nr:lipid droplet-associated protein [Saccharomonospora saliphila]
MRHLPFPLRVAAGLAVTTVERARDLPRQLTELPVTAVSQVLHASMRVQQHVTELAIKGDTALSSLRRPEEQPDWATFDEDLEEEAGPSSGPSSATRYSATPETAGSPVEPAGPAADAEDPWAAEERALAEDHTDGEFDSPEAAPTSPAEGTGPAGIADYDELTLPQVRARLRALTQAQLEELLDYERAHGNRPSFTGMLSRRLSTVRQAASARAEDPAQQ